MFYKGLFSIKFCYRTENSQNIYLYTEEFALKLAERPEEYEDKLDFKFTLENSTNLSAHEENFLHLLIHKGTPTTIDKFLNSLAVKNKPKLLHLLNQENKVGWIPLYYAFEHKSVDLLRTIINFDQKTVEHICGTGSVLIKACEVTSTSQGNHNLDCLEYLISPPISLDVNQADKEGCTPLYMACYKGNFEVVKCLIENGADPGICCVKGSTALHICAERDFR